MKSAVLCGRADEPSGVRRDFCFRRDDRDQRVERSRLCFFPLASTSHRSQSIHNLTLRTQLDFYDLLITVNREITPILINSCDGKKKSMVNCAAIDAREFDAIISSHTDF